MFFLCLEYDSVWIGNAYSHPGPLNPKIIGLPVGRLLLKKWSAFVSRIWTEELCLLLCIKRHFGFYVFSTSVAMVIGATLHCCSSTENFQRFYSLPNRVFTHVLMDLYKTSLSSSSSLVLCLPKRFLGPLSPFITLSGSVVWCCLLWNWLRSVDIIWFLVLSFVWNSIIMFRCNGIPLILI